MLRRCQQRTAGPISIAGEVVTSPKATLRPAWVRERPERHP
jgi:hypothetical protein